MKIYHDHNEDGNWTRISAIKQFPVILTRMDETSQISFIVKDFEGALYSTWEGYDWIPIKVEDESTEILWQGFLWKKKYNAGSLLCIARGLSAKLDWTPIYRNYIYKEGTVKTVPEAGNDTIGLQDIDGDGIGWANDELIQGQDLGIIIRDTSENWTTVTYTTTAVAPTNEFSVAGNVGGIQTCYDGIYYRVNDKGFLDAYATLTVEGANIDSTTQKLKEIVIKFNQRSFFAGWFTKSKCILEILYNGTDWIPFRTRTGMGVDIFEAPAYYTVTLTGTDTELAKWLGKTGDNYDKINGIRMRLDSDISSGDNICYFMIDYCIAEISYYETDITPITEAITDNGASWVECSGIDFTTSGVVGESVPGEKDGDSFMVGFATHQILTEIFGIAGIGLQIDSTLTKFMAQRFKGTNAKEVLNKIKLLEGAHWFEDHVLNRVIIAKEADFADSTESLTQADYSEKWELEDDNNYVSAVEVFGCAGYNIYYKAIDPAYPVTNKSPIIKTIIEETIMTKAEARDVAEAQLLELKVKRPSIKVPLKGVYTNLRIGKTTELTMARPTRGADDYPIRKIERVRLGHGEIKTTVYCGLGHSSLEERITEQLNQALYLAHQAHTDRLISTNFAPGVMPTAGDIGGLTAAINLLIGVHSADDDIHHDVVEDLDDLNWGDNKIFHTKGGAFNEISLGAAGTVPVSGGNGEDMIFETHYTQAEVEALIQALIDSDVWVKNFENDILNGKLTVDTLLLENNSGDNFHHSVRLYDNGADAQYGIMLWNTNTTIGNYSTAIYGANQGNRRISFLKVNTNPPTLHAHFTEGAYFDLDDWKFYLTANLVMGANKITGVAKGADANDALALGTNLIDSAYDPDVWQEAEVAPSRNSVKDVFIALTNAVVYKGTWSPATTDTFTDEANGDASGIDFIDFTALYDGALEVVAAWQGREKVLETLDDITPGEDPIWRHFFTQTNAGTHEFMLGSNNTGGNFSFSIVEEGEDYIFRCRINGDQIDYWNRASAWTPVLAGLTDDTWYKVKLVWRADNTCDIYVDDIKLVDNVDNHAVQVVGADYFEIRMFSDTNTIKVYLDSYYDLAEAGYPPQPDGEEKGWWYLVDQDGYSPADGDSDTPARWYEIGDWIIWNETRNQWDILRNVQGDNILKVSPGDDIQTAIDELESIGEGVIRLLPGTHVITTAIGASDSDVILKIDGYGDISVLKTVGDIDAFSATDFAHLTLSNFKIDTASQTTVGRNGIVINEGNNNKCLIENITVEGDELLVTHGIRTYSENVTIRNCHLNTMRIGILATTGAHKCNIYENTFDNIGLYNIFIDASDYVICDLNRIDGNAEVSDRGIYISNSEHVSLTDNYVYDCGIGIRIGVQSDRGTYIGNTVIDCSGAGLQINIGDHNSITANMITGCGDGIQLDAGASNNYITVNMIENSTNEDIDDDSDGSNYILDRATDVNTVEVYMHPVGGASEALGIVTMNGDNQGIYMRFYVGDKIDSTKDIIVKYSYQFLADDAVPTDVLLKTCVLDGTNIAEDTDINMAAGNEIPDQDAGIRNIHVVTIPAAHVEENQKLELGWYIDDGAFNGFIWVYNCSVEYFMKRIV